MPSLGWSLGLPAETLTAVCPRAADLKRAVF